MNQVKTKNTIYLDYNKARQRAEELDNVAAKLRVDLKRFNESRNELSAAWTGDNAVKFTSKMGAAAEEINNTAIKLERIAETIRVNAKRIYDAEMKALEIAAERQTT